MARVSPPRRPVGEARAWAEPSSLADLAPPANTLQSNSNLFITGKTIHTSPGVNEISNHITSGLKLKAALIHVRPTYRLRI